MPNSDESSTQNLDYFHKYKNGLNKVFLITEFVKLTDYTKRKNSFVLFSFNKLIFFGSFHWFFTSVFIQVSFCLFEKNIPFAPSQSRSSTIVLSNCHMYMTRSFQLISPLAQVLHFSSTDQYIPRIIHSISIHVSLQAFLSQLWAKNGKKQCNKRNCQISLCERQKYNF